MALFHHDSRGYEVAASEAAKHARTIMEKKIAEGRASAGALIESVMNHAPHDQIARGSSLAFFMKDAGKLGVLVGRDELAMNRYAMNQIAAKARIPMAYVDALSTGEAWQEELLVENFARHYRNGPLASARHLCRSVDGTLRGFLSDKFRRLDDRPLVEAFVESVQHLGMLPVEGVVTDTRVALKAVFPMVFEPVPNEVMMVFLQWGNSNYGAAKHSCSLGVWRLWCTNKAMMDEGLSNVHVGARLDDRIEFSSRTYELDTKTAVSALRDVVGSLAAPERVNSLMGALRAANEKNVEWKHVKGQLEKVLLKKELKAAQDAFESEDVINLPPVRTAWRASNALSWIANQVEDKDRKLALEKFAGDLATGRKPIDVEAEAA